jgi:hypothetical protein
VKGDLESMTKNEMELIELLHENDNPEQALLTAINVFAAFLERLEVGQEPRTVYLLESS